MFGTSWKSVASAVSCLGIAMVNNSVAVTLCLLVIFVTSISKRPCFKQKGNSEVAGSRTAKEGLSLSSGLVVSGHRQNELALNG